MSKEAIKKATFEDLINKKLQKEANQNKTKDIIVPSMGKSLTFKMPKENDVLEALDEIGDSQNTSKIAKAYKKLIYQSCEMLQDTKLHEDLGVVDPFDIVDKIFDLSDKIEIGNHLIEMLGMTDKVNQIKN